MFFDRGIVDALGMAVESRMVNRHEAEQEIVIRAYNKAAFFFPPWPGIYKEDKERDQTLEESFEIAQRVHVWYETLGFTLLDVPLQSATRRANWIEEKTLKLLA